MSFGVSGTRCSVEEMGWVQRKPGWSRDSDLYPAVVQWEHSALPDGGEISPASEVCGRADHRGSDLCAFPEQV